MSEDDVFSFGPFRFLPRRQSLLREDRPVKLGCRAMEILHVLLRHAGQVVSKKALMRFVWPDTFVDDSNLKVHICSLRRALGETSPQPSYIATVPGQGYRFLPAVIIEGASRPRLARVTAPPANRFPPERALVGRKQEIEAIARALDIQRIVTLVGQGGVGKTTVAIAIAHRERSVFADGICFADLSTTNDCAFVPNVLAAALGLRGDLFDVTAAIVGYLSARRILVVLDNCEHVLPAAAMIAARLQEAQVKACLLATSRAPLGLGAEHVQLIQPLDYPSPAQVSTARDALQYPSVQLLATRAMEWADYRLSDGDASAVAALCKALSGLPLAIELAAAKMGSYGAVTLLESLDRRFSLLKDENEGTHSRHRTLWSNVDWSYRLLPSSEATILRLVSVFSGTFNLADIVPMARAAGYDAYQTTVSLGGLVAKSLVTAEVEEECLRYKLLACARSYALEKLYADPVVREIHLDSKHSSAHHVNRDSAPSSHRVARLGCFE